MKMYRSLQRGFTLMELLKVVGIMGIVLSFGVPSMASLVRSNRVVGYTNDFISTVQTARAAALSNIAQVTVCKSLDQASCDAAASWNDGWIAFIDDDEDEIRDLAGTPEALILAHQALAGSYTLQSAAFADWIAFRPNAQTLGSVGNAGTFSLCSDAGANYGRDISITRTGSPLVEENAAGACP